MEARAEILGRTSEHALTDLAGRPQAVARVLGYQLLRNAKIFLYFKVHAGLNLVQTVAQLLVFLYIGDLIGRDRFAALAGGSYASYLVVGMILLQVLDKGLIGPFVSLSGAYWTARLESLMLSPHSLGLIVGCDTAWYFVMTTINALAILGVGLLFGASFAVPSSWPLLLATVAMAIAAVVGLGLISASTFSLLNAKGNDEPVSWAVHLLQGLVCGLYFPFALLPTWLQFVGLLLPHTYAIDCVRRLAISGYTTGPTLPIHGLLPIEPVLTDLLGLVLCAAIYLPLGVHLFGKGIDKSRQVGSLSRWT